MQADPKRPGWPRAVALTAILLSVLAPIAICGLLRFGAVTPAEFTVSLGPLRIATTCFSRKTLCSAHENTNPPPDELFLLMKRRDQRYSEDVLFRLPLR